MLMKAFNLSSFSAVLISILTFVLNSNQQEHQLTQQSPAASLSSPTSSTNSSPLPDNGRELSRKETINNLITTISSNYSSILDIPWNEINQTTLLAILEEFNKTAHELQLLSNVGDDNQSTLNVDQLPQQYYVEPIVSQWQHQLLLVILYSGIALMALFFNVASIVIIVRRDCRLSIELWKFLVSLSAADIGMAFFCIPFTYTEVMLNQWVFAHWFCPILRLSQSCFVFVSIWTLVVIGLDRYFAMVHPLYLFPLMRANKVKIIFTVWALGIMFGMTQYCITIVKPIQTNDIIDLVVYKCTETWSTEESRIYTVLIFILAFAGPVLLLVLVYAAISLHLFKQFIPGYPNLRRDRLYFRRKIKTLKILATIVSLFVICWLPIHLVQLCIEFETFTFPSTSTEKNKFYRVYFTAHFLSMTHSMFNPVAYCYMSDKFMLNLCDIFRKLLNMMKNCEWEKTPKNTSVCQSKTDRNCMDGSVCTGCLSCVENIELVQIQSSFTNLDSVNIGRNYTTLSSRTNKTLTKITIHELGETQQIPIVTVTHYDELLSDFHTNHHIVNNIDADNNNGNSNGYLRPPSRHDAHPQLWTPSHNLPPFGAANNACKLV